MTLKSWEKNGWLLRHKTSPQEIRDLLRIATRDLSDCDAKGLSPDWRFNIAYNAALQAATAALAAAGFRAAREQYHYRTIQSLALTIGWPAVQVDRFDRFRKKRNILGYETAGVASEREAREMHELATTLREDVLAWLRKQHPKLLQR